MDKNISVFDWERILLSEDLPIAFFGEIVFRTIVMFLLLIMALKFLSKRGVKQLSVFELAILIALGSATGDPMFYKQVPLTYGILVLIVVILLYRVITYFTGKIKAMETLLEGKPIALINDGTIDFKNYKKVGLPNDKFFAELRLKGIDHLGQVRKAYLETSGEISIYVFEDKDVRPGLPIYPELIDHPLKNISNANNCACTNCGNIQMISSNNTECNVCEKDKWLIPESKTRIK